MAVTASGAGDTACPGPARSLAPELRSRPLREVLMAMGLASAGQWDDAAAHAPAAPEGELVSSGALSAVDLARAKAAQRGLPFAHLNGEQPTPAALAAVSAELMMTGEVLPLHVSETVLRVAIADPANLVLRDRLLRDAGDRRLELVVAPKSEIQEHVVFLPTDDAPPATPAGDGDAAELRTLAAAEPVVKAVMAIIDRALELDASDIHLGNWTGGFEARFRVDGALLPGPAISPRHYRGVISRLKVLARLDIAQHRLPQDGEFSWRRGSRGCDLRIVTVPTKRGEHAVIRIFGQTAQASLSELGFEGSVLETLRRLCALPNGIVLVTGPTGSGKTTTLATLLSALRALRPDDALYSVEDPVEQSIPGVAQIPVLSKAGLSFPVVLRSLLRADPDVLAIGEIRDSETAKIAIQAALTGHLVLSTLHTNDAPSAVTRLVDMGMEPYLLADTVRAVIAQRLVRRVCVRCTAEHELDEISGALSRSIVVRRERRGAGCPACHGGYRGRIAISELLVVTRDLAALIARGSRADELRRVAGMRSLLDDGAAKVAAGVTTVSEVRRVTTAAIDEPAAASATAVPAA